jgi:hypothetical protein
MLARPLGRLRPACGLLLLAAFLVCATSASASWHLPGGGVGVAQASPDFHAPTVVGGTIAPPGITAPGGAVRPGGQFVVYANAFDTGTGVAWVRTNVSTVKAGSTSVSLSPCTSGCTIGGTTYGWSSPALTADAGLSQGAHSYSVWSGDNIGNVGAPTNYSADVDSTNPAVSVAVVAMASPATVGWVNRSGTYAVYAKAADAGSPASGLATVIANVSSLTPGTTALALTTCSSNCTVGGVTYTYKSASVTAGASIADGSASFSVAATDAASNSATANFTATADSTAPVLTSAVIANSSPSTPGFVKPGGAYILYANVSDAGGIATLTANVSNVTPGQTALALTACASCTVGGVTYGYKTASQTAGAAIAAGSTSFTVTAVDKAANTTGSSYSVTVDSAGPTVSGVAVANTTTSAAGWVRKSGAYIVYANATDPSGVSSVKANVSTLTSGQTALALSACSTSCTVGGVTYGYKSASKTAAATLAAGAVSFTVTATDGVSNTTTANGSATADNTAPTAAAETLATVTTGVPGYLSQGRSYVVYANAADAASGIFSVTAKVSTLTTGQTALALPACSTGCTAGGTAYGFTSAPLTANASISGTSKTFTVTVTDQAGNATTSAAQSVTIDNAAPAVAITFPASTYNGGWSAGCSTPATDDVCGTATDSSSGVWGVQISLREATSPSLYWNPATSSFSSATEVLMPVTLALPNWSMAAASAWFTNLSSYTIRAVATDAAANTATVSTTFTFKP